MFLCPILVLKKKTSGSLYWCHQVFVGWLCHFQGCDVREHLRRVCFHTISRPLRDYLVCTFLCRSHHFAKCQSFKKKKKKKKERKKKPWEKESQNISVGRTPGLLWFFFLFLIFPALSPFSIKPWFVSGSKSWPWWAANQEGCLQTIAFASTSFLPLLVGGIQWVEEDKNKHNKEDWPWVCTWHWSRCQQCMKHVNVWGFERMCGCVNGCQNTGLPTHPISRRMSDILLALRLSVRATFCPRNGKNQTKLCTSTCRRLPVLHGKCTKRGISAPQA